MSSIGEDGINETLIPGHYIPRHLAKRKENIYPRKHLYTNVRGCFNYNSQNTRNNQISIKCRDILQNFVVYPQIEIFSSVQLSSVAQSCLTIYNAMNCNTSGLPVHQKLPEFTQIHVHQVIDAIQLSHPLSSPSSPAPNPSQHQSLFQ